MIIKYLVFPSFLASFQEEVEVEILIASSV